MLFLLLSCSGESVPKSPVYAEICVQAPMIRLGPDETTTDLALNNGIVVALGEEARAMIGPSTVQHSFETETVVPGFHDNHTHLLAGSFVMDKLLVVGVSTMATLVNRTASYLEENPEVAWVVGYGWIYQTMDNPDGRLLDTVVSDRPAGIFDSTGHAILVNSFALELAGIHGDTLDPDGGTIVRDPESGEPTGLLLESAVGLIGGPMIDATTDEMLASNLIESLAAFTEAGLTSISEIMAVPGVTLGRPWLYTAMDEAGLLPLRIHYYLPAFNLSDVDIAEEIMAEHSSERVRPGGIKLWVDGSSGSGGSWSLEPAVTNAEEFGVHYFTAEEIVPFLRRAESGGYGIKFHTNGDAAVQATLDALSLVFDEEDGLSQAYSLEHAALVDDGDLFRLQELGVTASVQPALAMVGPLSDQAALWGEERMEIAWDLRRLHDSGVSIAIGTDWPVWPTVDTMVNLWTAAHGLGEKSLTLAEAFHGYTAGGWRSIGRFGEGGCLDIGCPGDWIVLSSDPFTAESVDISNIKVLSVWLDGMEVE